MNKKRKAFIQELKEMGLSEDQFLNQLLIKNPSPAEMQGMLYLELYYKADEREQKIIKSRLINLALREKKDWAWNPLIKLVERELGDPIGERLLSNLPKRKSLLAQKVNPLTLENVQLLVTPGHVNLLFSSRRLSPLLNCFYSVFEKL